MKWLLDETLPNLIKEKTASKGEWKKQEKTNVQPKDSTQKYKCTNAGCKREQYEPSKVGQQTTYVLHILLVA